jgi:hypothetical protein
VPASGFRGSGLSRRQGGPSRRPRKALAHNSCITSPVLLAVGRLASCVLLCEKCVWPQGPCQFIAPCGRAVGHMCFVMCEMCLAAGSLSISRPFLAWYGLSADGASSDLLARVVLVTIFGRSTGPRSLTLKSCLVLVTEDQVKCGFDNFLA